VTVKTIVSADGLAYSAIDVSNSTEQDISAPNIANNTFQFTGGGSAPQGRLIYMLDDAVGDAGTISYVTTVPAGWTPSSSPSGSVYAQHN
jgi:hypothetical protein